MAAGGWQQQQRAREEHAKQVCPALPLQLEQRGGGRGCRRGHGGCAAPPGEAVRGARRAGRAAASGHDGGA